MSRTEFLPANGSLCVATFSTDLGWIALVGSGAIVNQVTCGHRTRAAALAAVEREFDRCWREADWYPSLARRLAEYARGAPDDFRDVELDLDFLTPFARRVVKHCRAIGYGCTQSYGELAAASGAPRAARAVGNTMAGNRFFLIVPCHRVVHGGGDAGRLSASGRLRKTLRLLESAGRHSKSAGAGKHVGKSGRSATSRRSRRTGC